MEFNDATSQPVIAVAEIMTQLSLKEGLKQWGEKENNSIQAEMKQLHFRNKFEPRHCSDLTKKEKAELLESHTFLKQKRFGNIIGHTVAGGNKQCDFISKEEASSPTVATKAFMLTVLIKAKNNRDFAVIDITNAFIQTKVEDEKDMVTIRVLGELVQALLDIAPRFYKPFVTKDKKENFILLIRCLNAIYVTMIAGLLFYKKFRKTLLREGFEINPYDPCVANKTVNGNQQTIRWHVDDCKFSHRDKRVNVRFILVIKE